MAAYVESNGSVWHDARDLMDAFKVHEIHQVFHLISPAEFFTSIALSCSW